MSVANKLLQAAAGNAGEAVYVDDCFSTALYTTIVKSSGYTDISTGVDCNTDGGMVWLKDRTFNSSNHGIFDTERTNGYYLPVNSTDNGGNIAIASASSPFIRTTGIRFSASGGTVNHNWFNREYAENVIWSFKRQEKFFDVVTYTGNGTAGRTISHNLDSVPGMIIIKRTDSSADWIVWHRAIRSSNQQDYYLKLNSDAGEVFGSFFDGGSYSNVLPTSTQITLGDSSAVNASSGTYVMYLFAHNEQEFGKNSDEAIIHCGSYVADSTNGVAINCGFEPQWVLVKNVGAGRDWWIFDSIRGFTSAGTNNSLRPNLTNGESPHTNDAIRPTATGFEVGPAVDNFSVNGNTHIYMAIARPHKPASEFAATDLFAVDNRTTTTSPAFISGFPVDMAIHRTLDETGSRQIASRLTGSKVLFTDSVSTESTISSVTFDYMNGHREGASANADEYAWMFRRAKGFFDVVTYDGTGSDRTQAHNLGVAPELILIKRRGPSNADWVWYVGPLGTGKYMYGDGGAELNSTTIWSNTAPTANVFSLGNQGGGGTYRINGSGSTYIAYLWATVAGISKIGSYTGTGSDLNVDCGFSAGARFILIKRTDAGSDGWYVYDSVRGIVAGDDPYFLLNSTAVQVTNTDYIDPLSSGFTVTSSAPAGLNASSGTYIFLAIA